MTAQPFFTIGVTTYNRHELLRQTLDSILAQTFTDFEVIVGNDFTEEVLSGEQIGVSDSRVRFVNYPRNLQEVGNMNALLAMASGRYFTWMADDDLYEADFLRLAHEQLQDSSHPSAFYSSFGRCWGTESHLLGEVPPGAVRKLNGRDFLGDYFARRLKIVPCYGVFNTEALRKVVGGVEELCASGVGLYGEYMFVVRCSLLDSIVYTDAPLVLYRIHAGAWGVSNVELAKCHEAGAELIRRCGEVLRRSTLAADLNRHLLAICRIHLRYYTAKLGAEAMARPAFTFSDLFGLIAMLFLEIKNVERTMLTAAGTAGTNVGLVFAWYRVKYFLFLFLDLFRNRPRKSNHD